MKRKEKYFIIPVLSLVSALFIYPLLLSKYGDNLYLIRVLISIALLISCISLINCRIREFCNGEYIYYKLIGMKEWHIFKRLLSKNVLGYIIFGSISYIIAYSANICTAILTVSKFVLLILLLTIMIYLLHYNKVAYKLCVIGCDMGIMLLLIDILKKVVDLLEIGMDIKSIFITIFNNMVFELYYKIMFEKNNYIIVLLLVCFLPVPYTLKKCEEKVIELNEKGCNKKDIFSHITECKIVKRYFKELFVAMRSIGNLVSFLFFYFVYFLVLLLIGKNTTLIMIFSLIAILIVNYGMECVYTSDLLTKNYYKVLGEEYKNFLSKKIRASFVLNTVIFVMYIIKCISINAFLEEVIFLLVFQILNILYWNLFYSYFYMKMKRYHDVFDDLKVFIVAIGVLIPVLNIALCLAFYKKGKKRWDSYVDNGECC